MYGSSAGFSERSVATSAFLPVAFPSSRSTATKSMRENLPSVLSKDGKSYFGPAGGTELRVHFSTSYPGLNVLRGAKQYCTNSSNFVNYDSFDFEYIEYIDGQQITKREIGAKPLFFRCN